MELQPVPRPPRANSIPFYDNETVSALTSQVEAHEKDWGEVLRQLEEDCRKVDQRRDLPIAIVQAINAVLHFADVQLSMPETLGFGVMAVACGVAIHIEDGRDFQQVKEAYKKDLQEVNALQMQLGPIEERIRTYGGRRKYEGLLEAIGNLRHTLKEMQDILRELPSVVKNLGQCGENSHELSHCQQKRYRIVEGEVRYRMKEAGMVLRPRFR